MRYLIRQVRLIRLALALWWAVSAAAALDQAQASIILNAITPTGTGGIPGTYTALNAGAMKLRLTTTDSTAAAAGTTLTGTGSGDYTLANASTASSAGSNVTLPNVSGGTGGTTFWTNGSGSAWSLHAVELQDNVNKRNLWGLLNGDPVSVANGNSFLFAQNAITASLS